MAYARRAIRGVGIVLVMGVLASMVAYATRVYLARKLDPAGYGLFYAVFTFVLFFLFFRDLGLDQALTKYISEFKALEKYNEIKTALFTAVSFQILSSLVFSAFFFLLSDWLAVHYFKEPAASLLLKIMVGYTIFSIAFPFLKSFFTGFQKFKIFAFVDVVKNSLILILLAIFFELGLGVYAPVLAYVGVGLLLLIVFFPWVLKTFNLFQHKASGMKEMTRTLFLFGIPVMMTDVGSKVISYIDTLLLTSFRPLNEVGIYNVALPSAMIFFFFASAIAAVAFPIFVELWAKKELQKFREGMKLLHKYTLVFFSPIILTFFVFADFFILQFFGKQYAAAVLPFQVLLVGVLLFTEAQINHNIIAAIGKPKTITKIIFTAAVANTGLNLLLIPFYGIVGAAAATLISYALAFLLSSYLLAKYTETKMPLLILAKTILVSLLFVGSALYLRSFFDFNIWLVIPIVLTISFSLYGVVAWLLGLLDLHEIQYYIRVVIKKKDNTSNP